MYPPLSVLIVDDDPIVRSALAYFLDGVEAMSVVSAESGDAALAVLAAREVDVVLLDLVMPGQDGIATCTAILSAHPDIPVLMLTSLDRDDAVGDALAAGASGYLLKDAEPDRLGVAVRAVAAGFRVFSPEPLARVAARRVSRPDSVPDLTERDRAVVALLCAGASNKEIGASLHLSLSAVKAAVSAVLGKLDATSRLHAVVIAQQLGLG